MQIRFYGKILKLGPDFGVPTQNVAAHKMLLLVTKLQNYLDINEASKSLSTNENYNHTIDYDHTYRITNVTYKYIQFEHTIHTIHT